MQPHLNSDSRFLPACLFSESFSTLAGSYSHYYVGMSGFAMVRPIEVVGFHSFFLASR